MFWFGRATTVSVTCLVVMAGTGVSAFRCLLQRGGFGVVRFTTQWLRDPGERDPFQETEWMLLVFYGSGPEH